MKQKTNNPMKLGKKGSLGGLQKGAVGLFGTGLVVALISYVLLVVQGTEAIVVNSAAYNIIGTTITAGLTMAGFFAVLAIGIVVKPVLGMFKGFGK